MGTISEMKCFHLVTFYRVMIMEIKRMRDLREDADTSQKAIAEYLNMHRSVYRRYESGEREADYQTLIRLADYFNVSVDYLLERTENPAVNR